MSLSAATCAKCRPVLVLPVKEIFCTKGCLTICSPTTEPLPVNTLNNPAGKPASSNIAANSSAIRDVASAGFRMTALPPANAGTIFCISEAIGEFHGGMAAITPNGS